MSIFACLCFCLWPLHCLLTATPHQMNSPSVQLSSPQHQTTKLPVQINSELSALIFWAVCRHCRHTVIKLTDTTDLSSLRRSAFSLTWLVESPPLQITWSGWRALTKVGVNTCIFHIHNFLFFFCYFFSRPFHCSLWGFSTHCCLSMVSSQSAHYDLWPLTSARQFSSDKCCTLDFFLFVRQFEP